MGDLCVRCLRRADHLHHRTAKGMGGSRLYEDTRIPLCESCHRWVHEHPQAALEAGYRELRNVR